MFISIQYLRAIAAMLVLLAHISHKLASNSSDLLSGFNFGGSGVDLFFVISGFVMCASISKNSDFYFMSFILKRFLRILPLYWALSLLAFLVYMVKPSLINSGGQTVIIESFILLPSNGKYLINNGWTLSYEFYFYFLFSIFTFYFNRYMVFLSVFLLALFTLGMLIDFDNIYTGFLFNAYLLDFAIGVLVYKFFSQYRNIYLGYICIFISVCLLYIYSRFELFTDLHRVISYTMPMTFLFIGSVFLENNKYIFKAESIVSKIGLSSYSLYLIHPFALGFTTVLSRVFYFNKEPIIYFLIMLLSSLALGWVCYFFVEKKINQFIKDMVLQNEKFCSLN